MSLSVGGNNASTTFSGGLSGAGSLTKLGAGTFTVTGPNTYSGNTTVSAGTVQILGGQLPAANEYVGPSGNASVVQSSGTHSVSANLYFGYNWGSRGTYNLSGGALLCGQNEYVGFQGSGSFTQTGGTHTVAGSLTLGIGGGSNGTYCLSGSGLLSVAAEYVGCDTTGSLTQSGGTNFLSGSLVLGQNSGSAGTYNLNGGLLVLSSSGMTQGGGSAAFNFGGGTLGAAPVVLIAEHDADRQRRQRHCRYQRRQYQPLGNPRRQRQLEQGGHRHADAGRSEHLYR